MSPTEAGSALVQIRHARPLWCCAACTAKALAMIGITIDVEHRPPPVIRIPPQMRPSAGPIGGTSTDADDVGEVVIDSPTDGPT